MASTVILDGGYNVFADENNEKFLITSGGDQLPTTDRCARGRPGQGSASSLHVGQHDSGQRSLGKA